MRTVPLYGKHARLNFRGDGTAASPAEIYDAGHEATIAGGAR
jgi:hypothetical protein